MTAEAAGQAPRLVADLGGTNARFALAGADGRLEAQSDFSAADHPSPLDAARAYLSSAPLNRAPAEAVFAVAAPLSGDDVRFTNSSWRFSIEEMRRGLGLQQLRVMNDFEALAWSLPKLNAGDLRQLGGGASAPNAPCAAIGPGTGLGVAGLLPGSAGWTAIASEGGHASFTPHDELDLEIWRILHRRFGHVSTERVASGPGLVNLYSAIAEIRGVPAERLSPEEVSARGAAGADPICGEAIRRFAGALGSAAGDLALTFAARGGVYIGGGVVPKLDDAFDVALFRARFAGKGRLRAYLEAIPTWLILHPNPALLGAALVAI